MGVQAWVVECEEWPALFFLFFSPSFFFFFAETKTKVPSYRLARRNSGAGGRPREPRGGEFEEP